MPVPPPANEEDDAEDEDDGDYDEGGVEIFPVRRGGICVVRSLAMVEVRNGVRHDGIEK